MARIGKIIGVSALVLIGIPVIGVSALALTFDPNAFRGQISDMLTKTLNRKVSLNGDMSLGFADGLALKIKDTTVANAEWAKGKPDMVKIGEVSLNVKLRPLLEQKLDIEKVTLSDAEFVILKGPNGQPNYEFDTKKSDVEKATTEKGAKAVEDKTTVADDTKTKIDLNVKQVALDNVHVKVDNATDLMIDDLVFEGENGTKLTLKAVLNKQAINVKVDGAAWQDTLAGKDWPFTAQGSFAENDFKAKGKITESGKVVQLPEFAANLALGSNVSGNIVADLRGARPRVTGQVEVDKFSTGKGGGSAAPASSDSSATAPAPAAAEQKSAGMVPDVALDLSPLKSADADIRYKLSELQTDKFSITDIVGHLVLKNGNLNISDSSMVLLGNVIKYAVGANASSSPYSVKLSASGANIDTNKLMADMDISNKLELGAISFNVDLAGMGNSTKSIVNTLSGKIRADIGAGNLAANSRTETLDNIIRILSPKTGAMTNAKMTCGAVIFDVQNGVLNSRNNMLVETNIATVAGGGSVDLKTETMNMAFKPLSKDASIAGFVPSFSVSGALTKPRVVANADEVAKNVATMLLNADVADANAIKIPQVPTTASGNACVAALQNPIYVQQTSPTEGVAGKGIEKGREFIQNKTKGLVEKLDKGVADKLDGVLGGENSPLKGLFGQ